ncbi:MAG TPA: response regulator [Thermoanaerobaculia bacterium]|nr:response regulator [Thermoanaerobaculia bacterium]
MSVAPSCQALLIHDDDAFRKSLIATLDRNHFAVTFTTDGDEALQYLRDRTFRVVLLGVSLKGKKGLQTSRYLRENRDAVGCGVIILGDPDPEIRTFAPWADETLLKPVDADYVAQRALVYCTC